MTGKPSETIWAGQHDGLKKRGADARVKHDKKTSQQEQSSVESTWWTSEGGGPPLTELTAESQGPLSPWGEDHTLPLPPEQIGYQPPTARPNRAGAN